MNIRRAGEGDIAALSRLCAAHAAFEGAGFDAACFERGIGPALSAPMPRLWVYLAEDQGTVVGYVALSREFSTWRAQDYLHMDCLFIEEGQRGSRLGQRLFAAAQAEARDQGLETMEWQTPDWNAPAIAFYQALGAKAQNKLRFSIG